MKKLYLLTLLILLPLSVRALEVDREVVPRITLGGKLVATADVIELDSDPAADDYISVEDSTVLMRFDKRLYGKGVAGAVVGIEEEDDVTRFQQLHALYWDQDMKLEIGRTRLRNTLIEFPMLRDESLLTYTHVGNASSDDKYDQIYGELVSADWYFDEKIQRLGVWFGGRRNADKAAFVNAPSGFDSHGFSYVYEQPEDLFYVSRLRHAGIRLDRQQVDVSGSSEWLQALLVGAEINLNLDPQANWSLSGQVISNNGIDGVVAAAISNGAANLVSQRAQAASVSVVTSVRYAARPHLLTRWQTALTLAYKEYSDVASARHWSIAPSLFYRIGQGIDLLAQAMYTDFSAALGAGNDTRVQLGIAFSFETVFNDNIGERDSILNLEHGYIQ